MVPKQETTYRRPKRQIEAAAWRHSLSYIPRPYDKLRNNEKDKRKKNSSLIGGKHEKEIMAITYRYPNARSATKSITN